MRCAVKAQSKIFIYILSGGLEHFYFCEGVGRRINVFPRIEPVTGKLIAETAAMKMDVLTGSQGIRNSNNTVMVE